MNLNHGLIIGYNVINLLRIQESYLLMRKTDHGILQKKKQKLSYKAT